MNSVLQNTRRHDITVARSGRIDLTARVVHLLDIRPGDVLDISIDGCEWYLYVRLRAPLIGRHVAQCYPSSRRGRTSGSYRLYSKQLADAVYSATGRTDSVLRLPCGTPVTIANKLYLPIIIRCIL